MPSSSTTFSSSPRDVNKMKQGQASPKLLTSAEVANKYYRGAKLSVILSLSSTAFCLYMFSLGFWTFLPLFALHLELIARLFDYGIVGKIAKVPSPPSAFKNPVGVYTWEQLAQHSNEQSAWIAIDGLVYDITEFVDRHPGGREIILLCAGRDATDLFNSYHPFAETPRKILNKFHIGSLITYEHPIYKADSGFYKEASQAVKKYFKDNKLDSKNPMTGVYRMAPVYIVFMACYFLMYYTTNIQMIYKILLAILLGACQGMPLTGWMHDASHTAIGNSESWWWNVGRFSLDYFSGSSMLSWRNQHVLGHHVYTNVMGADPDLPATITGDPRRLIEQQTYFPIYKYQHYYLIPLYGILALKSRVQDLTEIFSKLSNGPVRVNPIITQDHLRMISSKCVWFFYRVIIPYVFFKTEKLALLFFISEFTTGYWLAFNFQVSHISDHAEFLYSDQDKRNVEKTPAMYQDEWAISQIRTTIDYGHKSVLATYFSGALNYQTIHHLFPSVSQYHYPEITPIVMEVAKKYDIDFTVFDGFPSAFMAHWRHLRNLGREGKAAELKLE